MSHRRHDALSVGFDPTINLGEDMLMGIRLAQRGTIVHDHSRENTVLTDGRRFLHASDVLRHAAWKIKLLLQGKLYRHIYDELNFEDVR